LSIKTALIIALPEEAEGINSHPIYLSGCGKVNATIATMRAIRDGYRSIINFGSAGAITKVSGLIEVTGYVDRDIDATALNYNLGQTPFEEGVIIGHKGVICGTGDKFVTQKPDINCDIVDMEAYAIAKTCLKEGAQFRSFKYISDNANKDSGSDWNKNLNKGNKLFQQLLNEIELKCNPIYGTST